MAKILPEDLDKISDKIKRTLHLREGKARARIIVHMGTCGIAAGARPVMSAFMDEVDKSHLSDVIVTISSCAGLCSREPMVTIELQNELPVKYVDMSPDKAKEVFSRHVVGGNIVTEYALASGSERVL